jgi:hypothetical protein
MSAEAAIYPTSNSVSNRFLQNSLNPIPIKPESLQRKPAASKETTKPSQASFSEETEAYPGRNTWKPLRTSLYFLEGGF